MKIIEVPRPGEYFIFRFHPRWQFWRRGFGGAQVLGIEPEGGVVHVRIFGYRRQVLHLPILASQVAPFIVEQLGVKPIPEGYTTLIQAWRDQRLKGYVGAFSVPIGKAAMLAEETAITGSGGGDNLTPASSSPRDPLVIESAYPVRSGGGHFTTVRVIVPAPEDAVPELTITAHLVSRGWLRRVLAVVTNKDTFVVEYSGRGLGYESVLVDGDVAVRPRSWGWFVPFFPFPLASQPAVLEVRVWPWLGLRVFRLSVGEQLVYSEPPDTSGSRPNTQSGKTR